MQKRSLFMNERGFFLPYVVVICFILFTTVASIVKIYEVEIESTNVMIEQIVHETIIQMGIAQFQEEKPYKNYDNGKVTYTFPPGEITIQFERIENGRGKLALNVVTNDDSRFVASANLLLKE